MFGKLSAVVIILCAIAFGYLIYINPDEVVFHLNQASDLSVSGGVLALAAFASGIALAAVLYSIKELSYYIDFRRRKRLERDKKRSGELLLSGMNLIERGKREEGFKAINESLAKDRRNVDAVVALVDGSMNEGRYEEALTTIDKWLPVNGANFRMLLKKAEIFERMGANNEQIVALTKLQELFPDNYLILKKLRGALVFSERWIEAYSLQKTFSRNLSKREPHYDDESRWYYALRVEYARQLYRTGHQDGGIKRLRSVIDEQPSFSAAYLGLGAVIEGEGAEDEAAGIYRKGFEKTGELVFVEKIEALYYASGKPEAVLEFFDTAIAADPSDALKIASAGFMLRIEMIDEATTALEKILSINDNLYYGALLLALAYEKRERHDLSAPIALRLLGDPTAAGAIPYICAHCHASSDTYGGFCPSCGSIGTLARDYLRPIH